MIFIILPLLISLGIYYLLFVAGNPKVVANEQMTRFLRNHVTIVNRKFYPSLFIWHGLLQSVFGLTLRLSNRIKLPYRREILEFEDGGVVALDYLDQDDHKEKTPIFLILPGIMNNSQTSYVKSLALSIKNTGSNVVVFNFRGLGGVPLKTPRSFSGSDCEDLVAVIAHLKLSFPKRTIIGVGTSMGGMVLGQYLTQYPEDAKDKIGGALLISCPFDSWSGTRSIEKGINLTVNKTIARTMRAYVKKHRSVFEDHFDLPKIFSGSTIRDFDRSFTAPQFGWQDIPTYYKSCSLWDKMDRISIPVFSLNAEDDPIVPGSELPYKGASKVDSKVAFIVTPRGGHLGFLDGILPIPKPAHWMERFAAQFSHAIIEYGTDLEGQSPF